MSIILVEGPPKSGKSTVANAIKLGVLAKGGSVLVLDEDELDSTPLDEPREHRNEEAAGKDATLTRSPQWFIQRLLAFNPFPGKGREFCDNPGQPDRPALPNPMFDTGGLKPGKTYDIARLPWKQPVTIVVVGKAGREMLEAMETAVPGFKAKFGPKFRMATSGEGA